MVDMELNSVFQEFCYLTVILFIYLKSYLLVTISLSESICIFLHICLDWHAACRFSRRDACKRAQTLTHTHAKIYLGALHCIFSIL